MEDVRIYDYEFNLLHIEHDIVSCNWKLYENDIGTFEMHFPLESRLAKVAAENRYLVAVQGRKQAVITGKQLTTEGVLYGRNCNWLLTRFLFTEKIDFGTGETETEGAETDVAIWEGALDAQTVCAYLLEHAMGHVDNFIFESRDDVTFPEVQLKTDGRTAVFDLVQQALTQAGGGHVLLFDITNKAWVFRLTQGKKLSFILSEDNRNAYDTEYTDDMQDYFTGGYYTDEENNMVHVASALSGIYAWETALSATSGAEAKKELAEKKIKASITAKTTIGAPLWGKDYELGDRVRTEIKKGAFRAAGVRKITGVSIWYENNDIGEEPIMEGADT